MGSLAGRLRDPVTLTVGALAVHRLTRLVIEDEATQRPRTAVKRWAAGTAVRKAHPQVSYLLTCPWCVSVWAAAGWAGLVAAVPAPAAVAGAVLAWSSVTGLLSSVE